MANNTGNLETLLEGLLAPTADGVHKDAVGRGNIHKHDKGWEPRIKMDNDGAPQEIISVPVVKDTPENEALIETLNSMGVSLRTDQEAVLVEVKQGVDWFRGEQGEDAVSRPSTRLRWVVRFKADIKAATGLDEAEVDDLKKLADAISKKVRPAIEKTERTLVVGIADWQIGQADGRGLMLQVARAAAIGPAVKAEVTRLKKAGTPVDRIILAGLGDLVEGCDGFYSNQAFTVQADRREQVKIARRLLVSVVKAAAETGLPVLVTGVSGNHGENRNGGGKLATTTNDNDDLAVLEQVYDVVEGRPGYEQVTFSIPTDRLVATVDVNGHIIALTHGHVLPSGAGGASKKAEGWWAKQAMAREVAGDASILLAGHLHHLNVTDIADGRLFVQAPALCDRSAHFAERYGMTSKSGLLTFTVGAGVEAFDNIKVHNLDVEAAA